MVKVLTASSGSVLESRDRRGSKKRSPRIRAAFYVYNRLISKKTTSSLRQALLEYVAY